jgi:hypothetical protein
MGSAGVRFHHMVLGGMFIDLRTPTEGWCASVGGCHAPALLSLPQCGLLLSVAMRRQTVAVALPFR